ncbi:MAG: TRAP transporter substrate-binding protein DctP [Proteobacteria bacterium]|nr:TRAP transporter substrate-binding protein DctP [Pseudomonadota bacterium]
MIRRTLAALLSSAALLAAVPAGAQEILSFGTANPDQHPLVTRILTPWVEAINAEDPSVLQIELRNGPMIVNHANFFDRLQDDVVQIVWGITAFDPGRFPRSLVTTLPFMVQNSEQGAVAACLMHERGMLDGEMSEIVPLAFVQFPQASLHFQNHPATSMEDMAGMKVMTGSPVVAGLVQAYGGTPLSINVPEMYQALQRGTAEGLVMNFTAFPGFRLHEVTTDHLIAPLGGALGMVFMMRDRYEALPEAARAILDRHSGCEVARELGVEVDAWEADALGFVQANGERRFHTLSEEQIAELVARVGAPIEAAYVERTPGGAEVLEAYRQALGDASGE